MNEEQLMQVEEGLNRLLKQYKLNLKPDDARRVKLTQEAKQAIRKVILSVAIKGDVKDISPIFSDNEAKIGWEVVDQFNKVVKFFG